MDKILASTGAFIGRPNNRDFKLIPAIYEKLDCDGLELMVYSDFFGKEKELSECVRDIDVSTLHTNKKIGELLSRNEGSDEKDALEMFKNNLELANMVGAKLLILHLWGGCWSDKNIDFNIEHAYELNELAKREGLVLTVENVIVNTFSPMKHLKTIREKIPEISFTWDTKMAAFHNEDEEIFKEENKSFWLDKRIKHLHVNDYGGGYMDWSNLKVLAIGEGRVDFEKFFTSLKKVGYEGDMTIESTVLGQDGQVDYERMNRCIKALRALYAKKRTP